MTDNTMVKMKGTNNDEQNTTQKIKYEATPTQLTTGCDLMCSAVNYRCCIMIWKYVRVIIRSVINIIFNAISINYIFPEYPVKTNCHEQTFFCNVVSNR